MRPRESEGRMLILPEVVMLLTLAPSGVTRTTDRILEVVRPIEPVGAA